MVEGMDFIDPLKMVEAVGSVTFNDLKVDVSKAFIASRLAGKDFALFASCLRRLASRFLAFLELLCDTKICKC